MMRRLSLRKNQLLLAFLFLLLTAYSSFFLDPTQAIKFLLLAIGCTIGNIWLLRHSPFQGNVLFREPALIVYLLYLLFTLTSLFYSDSLLSGIYEALKSILYFNLMLLIISLFVLKVKLRYQHFSYVFTLLQVLTILSIFYGIYERNPDAVWSGSKPYGGLYINPNLNSQLLFFSIPFTLYAILFPKYKKGRIIQIVALVLTVLMLLLLASKTIFLALAAAIVFGAVLLLFRNSTINRKLVIGGLAAFILVGALGISKIYPNHFDPESLEHRKELWIRTMGMIEDSPIGGQGLGSWRTKNLEYVPAERELDAAEKYSGIYPPGGAVFYERPHNDFLWIWSESGLFSLICYVLLLFLLLRWSVRLVLGLKGRKGIFYLLLSSTLIAFIIVSLLSFPKERIEQSIILQLIFAFILYRAFNRQASGSRLGQKLLSLSLLLLSCCAIYWASRRLQAEYHLRNVVEAKRNKDWYRVLKEAKKANNEAYSIGSDGAPIAWYEGIARMELNMTEQAHEKFEEAYRIHPTHLYVLNNLATTNALKNQPDYAMLLYRKALKVNPFYEDARINLSGMFFNAYQQDSAWKHIRKIPLNSIHPQFKPFATAILNQQYGAELHKIAQEEQLLKEADSLLQSKGNGLFDLYLETEDSKQDIINIFKERLRTIKDTSTSQQP